MQYIYTTEYYSATKTKITPFAATWLQLEILTLNEVRKKKTNTTFYSFMRNLKYGTNEPIYKPETDSQTQRTDSWLSRGRGEGVRWTRSLG